jgi:hypothetical protein
MYKHIYEKNIWCSFRFGVRERHIVSPFMSVSRASQDTVTTVTQDHTVTIMTLDQTVATMTLDTSAALDTIIVYVILLVALMTS